MLTTKVKLDDLGIPIYSAENLLEIFDQDQMDMIKQLMFDPNDLEVNRYNVSATATNNPLLDLYQHPGIPKQDFDLICQENWFMPNEYKALDIKKWIVDETVKNKYDIERIVYELELFEQHGLLNLLRWLKYFVDECRNHNIIWGVGRGSSVASYTLFVIGVHKIDSVKYDIPFTEFIRT